MCTHTFTVRTYFRGPSTGQWEAEEGVALFSDAELDGAVRDAGTALEETFSEEKKNYSSQFPDWISVHRRIIRWSIGLRLGHFHQIVFS